MKQPLLQLFQSLFESLHNMAPVILVISFFQLVVLQRPIPNLLDIAVGLVMVVISLTLFNSWSEDLFFPIE